jgi:hypothetical protein
LKWLKKQKKDPLQQSRTCHILLGKVSVEAEHDSSLVLLQGSSLLLFEPLQRSLDQLAYLAQFRDYQFFSFCHLLCLAVFCLDVHEASIFLPYTHEITRHIRDTLLHTILPCPSSTLSPSPPLPSFLPNLGGLELPVNGSQVSFDLSFIAIRG